MTLLFPVLVVLAGLGSSISFTQAKQQSDPFNSYLDGLRANQPEAALVRFAGGCGIDVSRIQPRYAIGPGGSFDPVKSLAQGLKPPEIFGPVGGTTEVVPFQDNSNKSDTYEVAPFQSNSKNGNRAEAAPYQSNEDQFIQSIGSKESKEVVNTHAT